MAAGGKANEDLGHTARLLALAAHFDGMAESFSKLTAVMQKSLAAGGEVDPELIQGHYEDIAEVLADAQVRSGPNREPELHAAIERLQSQLDETRELLP